MATATHAIGAATGLAIVAAALASGQAGWLDGPPRSTGPFASIVSGALAVAATAQMTEAGAAGGAVDLAEDQFARATP